MAITTIKIYPPIGIARLGNSPDEFFIGPEIPGVRTPPPGGYKDSRCRVKRQAARFRLFGYDVGGNLVQEITQADAAITWTAHVANKKASWKMFQGLNDNAPRRNSGIDAAKLEIDPGPRTLNGPNQAAGFNTGAFKGKLIPLGEMRTDADGRLLILGGFGLSESVPPGAPLLHYANNNDWHDDVSDGPVTATVVLNGATFVASPAWVICPPPDFAPPVDSITTLYDTLFQVAVDKGWFSIPATPSFTNDVFPILDRVLRLSNVSSLAGSGHFSFTSAYPPAGQAARQAIFDRVRDPNNPNGAAAATMPRLFDDSNGSLHTITKVQYAILQKWKDGNFVNDWTGSPPAPAAVITPEGLTRAALEACVGAAFFPGIEASWFMRSSRPSEYNYSEPFRLDHTDRDAGDVTKQMAVPWQADFYECYADSGLGLAWWPAQRPDDVVPDGGGASVKWIRDIVRQDGDPGVTLEDSHLDMVANWYKLGFVTQKGGQLVETERHVTCKSCYIILDRSTFSKDQVDGVLTLGSPANFDDSFYVMVEGFKPADLGVTGSNMTPAQLAPIAPSPSFTTPNNLPTPGLSASPRNVLLEDDMNLNILQRVTFVYRVSFADTTAFVNESENETLTATIQGLSARSLLTLNHQPNPFMLDGPVSWLSLDLRVFQITEGGQRFGQTMGSDGTAAVNFIQNLLTQFNGLGPINHPFNGISTDQQTSKLELSRSVNNKRVFNFAVAQVRYQGKVLDAADVRVFFRLFTTAATGLAYNPNSTYRRFDDGSKVVPLLGFEGGELVTIPCLASPRVDSTAASMTTQPEDFNKRTLIHAGANEVHGYFGCWLDFNQTEKRVPTQPNAGDGPYGANAKSIQDAIRGLHQCLAAEVYFAGQPIPFAANPGSSDKLAQRNLMIVESDNPGGPEAHTVVHTFELKPSLTLARETRAVEVTALAAAGTPAPPDELMIRWYGMPRDTDVQLYMPSIDADELLKFAAARYEAKRLERVDDHTIRCRFGDVTFIPIPSSKGANIAGLMTLLLPDSVKEGEFFRAVVHQISGRQRQIIGSFQVSIPVKVSRLLLESETRFLSVLRSISQSIAAGDRWRSVFDRYLEVVAGRVRGFGGNPDVVRPSPDGWPQQEEPKPCRHDTHRRFLFGLRIPWTDCRLEGELRVRVRFRDK
jgi:L-Lysine epsilon oxidase N-terminal/L-lysine epsilon oxidase C-terminal domain